MMDLKYSEIIETNRDLKNKVKGPEYNIAVLSNLMTYQLNDILEYALRTDKINAHITSGNYDNIIQDANNLRGSHAVLVFWEIANIIEGFQYKANVMAEIEIEALLTKVKSQIDFAVGSLAEASLVLFNKFSAMIFSHLNPRQDNLDKICSSLNQYLEQKVPPNVILIDIDKVIAKISASKSVDFKYYYSSKSLWSVDFYKGYAEYIKPIILSANGKMKKALILDCDNTLWKGILGEDGFDGIGMSPATNHGAIFAETQYLALEAGRQGVLLGLCSKNNQADVDEVFARHPDMKLKEENLAIKKINWDNKVANLRAIACELNIGLDSLVFVEDSDFEANYVRQLLPEVTVVQVPRKLHEYPRIMRQAINLFFNISCSNEDLSRAAMYRQQAEREQEKHKHNDLDDYLISLGLRMRVYVNQSSQVPRIAQMTQKTNQFNLTTKRYADQDIRKFMADKQSKVFAFELSDKFGDYGLTGLSVVKFDSQFSVADIDTYLISCRVIGRNVEFAFFDSIVGILRKAGPTLLQGKYIKTPKNAQVADYYERLGFKLIEGLGEERIYTLEMQEYQPRNLVYVEIKYGNEA